VPADAVRVASTDGLPLIVGVGVAVRGALAVTDVPTLVFVTDA
jgi:hypothetical protein